MNYKEYLKELSIVILGILIAYWVSNIGSDHKEHAIQKQVLLTILNELNDNHKNLETTIRSLDSLYLTYKKIQYQTPLSGSVSINYEGLKLRSIGYETAKNTGILKDVDYDLTSKIVENYESQSSIIENEKLMIDELFLSIKNKISNHDDVDFLMLQIKNLLTNLEEFDVEQKQLIDNIRISLKMGS
jgi:hypothetical protein